jgi:hypothetical protein
VEKPDSQREKNGQEENFKKLCELTMRKLDDQKENWSGEKKKPWTVEKVDGKREKNGQEENVSQRKRKQNVRIQ